MSILVTTRYFHVLSCRNKLDLPEDVFESSNDKEIIEEYDEEAEAAWRRRHTESVRKLKQAEAEKRMNEAIADVDVDRILENYEMVEELAEELDNLEINYDDKLKKVMSGELKIPESKKRIAHSEPELASVAVVNSSGDSSHNGDPPPYKRFREINNNDLIAQNNQEIVDLLKTYRCKIKEVLKNAKRNDDRNMNLFLDLIELKDEIEDDIRKINDEEYSDDDEQDSEDEETVSIEIKPIESKQEDTKRKVRFSKSLEDVKLFDSKPELYDNTQPESSNTIQIHFKHSDAKFSPHQCADNADDRIAHPGELRKLLIHSNSTASPAPRKSILKHSNGLKSPESPTVEVTVKKIFHSDFQIMGDVVEHSKQQSNLQEEVVHVASNDDAPKKVSRFKQMRLKA